MAQKVLLIVIDAASPRVMCPAIHTGRLPTFHRLMQAGSLHERSVTIFPSITPAATTSIITGEYPAGHGIAGASWYEESRNEVAYYGDDFWVAAREGFGTFLRDFLIRLNGERLTAPTLFEQIEGHDRRAACLNFLVYRGLFRHEATVPRLLRLLPGTPDTEWIAGPSALSLGDFVSGEHAGGRRLESSGGLLHRFGMDDAATGELLCKLLEAESLPDFTVAYFPDNDYRSHKVGPVAALPVLERVDELLGKAIEAGGGIDRILSQLCIVMTSDHGHCEILDDAGEAAILLDQVLDGFEQATLGREWGEGDELMICPNMRAAQIYVRNPEPDRIAAVIRAVLADPRVDQVLWRAEWTEPGRDGYFVESARGRLHVQRADGPGAVRDQHGNGWRVTGDPEVLQLGFDEGEVYSDDYPNALERIAGGLDSARSGEIWVTARPGCEFQVPGGAAHVGGGSHGALHSLDSLSPVLLAGAPEGVALPRYMRSVDIAPLCLRLLGLPSRTGRQPGRPVSLSGPRT